MDLKDKKNIIFLLIGVVIGIFLAQDGIYVAVNTKYYPIIVNKYTGNACFVKYDECIKIEKENKFLFFNKIEDTLYRITHKDKRTNEEVLRVYYEDDTPEGFEIEN